MTEGSDIGSTSIKYKFEAIFGAVQFDAYQLSLAQDGIVEEEVPFTSFYDDDAGYSMQLLLVNDIASY